MTKNRTKLAIAVAALAVAAGGIGTYAYAGGSDDADENVTGPSADRARQAALARLGGGTVTSVEREDEGGAMWEVEATRKSGATVEVTLDASYRVLGVDADSEDEAGDSGDSD
jgi:uncharacterized membrane protein YkoI